MTDQELLQFIRILSDRDKKVLLDVAAGVASLDPLYLEFKRWQRMRETSGRRRK